MKKEMLENNNDISSEKSESVKFLDLSNNSKSVVEEDIYAVFINNPEMNDQNENNKIHTSKYKWFNFLSKILMEQFSRLANAYFLVIAILQSIKELSYSGGTPIMLLPLSFVVTLNGLKDIYEDFKRKKSDKKENNSECYIFNTMSNQFEKKMWRDIKLGDIIKVENNHQFPADLLLLTTSDENGISYVETKNLDGEINLKSTGGTKGEAYDSILNHPELDLLFCVDKDFNCWLIPIKAIIESGNTKTIQLRTELSPYAHPKLDTTLYRVQISNGE
jgi:magnesium-transporting ATPase (P-type)